MKIIEEIEKMDLVELEIFCFNNFETMGMLLMNYLFEKFNMEKKEKVAIIISKLFDTLACHWEGVEYSKLYLYEKVLNEHPNSEIFLESILSFGLPPYNEKMKEHFDFEIYKKKLFELSPFNPILKMI